MRFLVWGLGAGVWATVIIAGCTPARGRLDPEREKQLVLAGVVDEADALAWSGQVEGAALELLLRCSKACLKSKEPFPAIEQLCSTPAEYRGRPASFNGRLVALEKLTPAGECARLGKLYRGVILLADGALVAFRCRAEGLSSGVPIKIPEKGTPVKLTGRFLKRWVAMDARGKDYMVMPLLAAHSVTKLAGPEAEKLARMRLGPGKLPLKEIHGPEVWIRPVVELAAGGALRLDGKPIGWSKLEDALAIQAARYRNPLGDSSLAVVVLADPRAPKAAAEKLKKMPRDMGARCVFRTLAAPQK